ncbi:amino acid ABC transporter permease [Dorea sp. YH-dor228]|uniref:amino acid ABC transporter permease n=1 Tax=Dorea sp. YH-dor228 TaxID=3151120 RepID=UPI002A8CAA50|nr:amino acid ABC transporter permease [Lachnospiraceae bacterium]MDY4208209.1 amino acid ABC transporter permease [Lachnospiraceae bacterium]
MKFDVKFFFSIIPKLILKIPYTLWLGCIAFAIAFVLGLILEICYTSKNVIIRKIAGLYISYFRSTPYITQLFIFYFGLPQIIPAMRNVVGATALVITIAMNSAAFIAEVIRGGLLAVDRGQREAALSIGLSPINVYKEIILPQAFVAAFPSLGNSFIMMIKNTAIGFTIGVVDILAQAKILAASSLNFFEAYISVGVVYWIILVLIDKLLKYIESKICRYL